MNKELMKTLMERTDKTPSYVIEQTCNEYGNMIVESEKLMKKEQMIAVRSDTSSAHFPEHIHNYVEIVYMYQGTKTNIVNGESVVLQQGDILFLSQNCRHENPPPLPITILP